MGRWRLIAIVLTFAWAIVFVTNNYFDVLENTPLEEIVLDNIFNSIPLILSLLLVVFPTKFILYTIMCCFMGSYTLFYGGGTNGMIMYVIGCLFALKAGVTFTKKILPCFIVPPLIALGFQYRLGIIVLYESILDILFLSFAIALTYILFNEKKLEKKKVEEENAVDISCLTDEEISMLQDVFNDKTFDAIGRERNKSESAIKQHMVCIYKKLNVVNKKELLALKDKNLLRLPS